MRVGEGWGVLLQEGGTGGKQLYPTPDDVQTQRVIFFRDIFAARALKKCYACRGGRCAPKVARLSNQEAVCIRR